METYLGWKAKYFIDEEETFDDDVLIIKFTDEGTAIIMLPGGRLMLVAVDNLQVTEYH